MSKGVNHRNDISDSSFKKAPQKLNLTYVFADNNMGFTAQI